MRMGDRGRRQRALRGLWVGLATAVVISLTAIGGWFASPRMQLNDTLFVPRPTTDRITIIAIDDPSRTAFGRSVTEWPRSLYGEVVTALSAAGARVIAFDVLFAESSAAAEDAALVDALRAARASDVGTRVVMPVVGLTPALDSDGGEGLLTYADVLQPFAELREVVDWLAFVNVLPDSDNIIRQQLSRVRVVDGSFGDASADEPTIALGYSLATYLAYLRVPPALSDQIVVADQRRLSVGPAATLPIDANGIWRQNFFRSATDEVVTFPTLSFADIAAGNFDPALIADRIVLIGVVNSTGAGDRYPVPFARDGRLVSGVEIHAHAIETLLQDLPVRMQPIGEAVITLTLIALGVSAIFAALRWWYAILVLTPLLMLGWIIVCSLIFERERLILDVLYGLSAIVVPGILHVVQRARDETVRRRRSELSLAVVEAIFEGSPGPIVVLDETLNVRRVNSAFRRQFAESAVPGRPFVEVLMALNMDEAVRDRWIAGLRAGDTAAFDVPLAEKTYAVRTATVVIPGGDRDRVVLINDISTLTDLNRLRTQMIRMASHDLKNPLNNILGFTELIHENAAAEQVSPTIDRFVEFIESSAHDMRRIIDGVLSLEKARSGTLEQKPVKLASVIWDVIVRCQSKIDENRQVLTTDLPDRLPPIIGDRFQLTQAIFNLIENAIKYTPNDGKISIRLKQAGGIQTLEIEDNGYGIPASAQPQIFTEFFRAVSGEAASIKGTGLGLSLVKTIIDLHGGRIRFTSVEGKGTTFIVELPVRPAPASTVRESAHAS